MSDEDERIRGKVAEILDNRELVLNIGNEDGVEVGMKFSISSGQGREITDPDTGVVIGSVDVPKTIVKVVQVNGPHLAVARTFRTIAGTPSLASLLSPRIYGQPNRTETLKVEPGTSLKAAMSDEEAYVKRGDIAVSTEED